MATADLWSLHYWYDESYENSHLKYDSSKETQNAKKNNNHQVQGNLVKETDEEIQKLLDIKVLEKSEHEDGEVISPISWYKNLMVHTGWSWTSNSSMKQWSTKQFNEEEEYEHFKMENFHSATNLMRQNCYMASVDLRRAYYSVSIHPDFRKFLKLKWRGRLYAYLMLP